MDSVNTKKVKYLEVVVKRQKLELKNLKKSLEKSDSTKIKDIEQHLQAVIDSIAGNHWWKNKNGRYLGCNDSIAKLLGLKSASELIGKTDYELPWADKADELVHNDNEVMRKGVPQVKEEKVTAKDGRIFTFLVTKIPLKDSKGRVIGTIGNSIDITELKEAKMRAEVANQAKSNFLSIVSHELRTPLNGIFGAAGFLKESKLNAKQKEFISDIFKSSEHLLAVINDVLDFSKLEASKSELIINPFELKELIKDVIACIKHQIENKNITISLNYDGHTPLTLLGDELRTKQIQCNFYLNQQQKTLTDMCY